MDPLFFRESFMGPENFETSREKRRVFVCLMLVSHLLDHDATTCTCDRFMYYWQSSESTYLTVPRVLLHFVVCGMSCFLPWGNVVKCSACGSCSASRGSRNGDVFWEMAHMTAKCEQENLLEMLRETPRGTGRGGGGQAGGAGRSVSGAELAAWFCGNYWGGLVFWFWHLCFLLCGTQMLFLAYQTAFTRSAESTYCVFSIVSELSPPYWILLSSLVNSEKTKSQTHLFQCTVCLTSLNYQK